MANKPNHPNRLGMKPMDGLSTIHRQYIHLAQAALNVLVLHGLPTNCEGMASEWQFTGTPEQQKALANLHEVIIANLDETEFRAAQKGRLS